MRDDALELERRFRQTGAPQDEVRLLRARLRDDRLTDSSLQLAAYVGHEVAGELLGEQAPATIDDLFDWVVGLAGWGKRTAVRAAIAVGRLTLPVWERRAPAADDVALPAAALRAAEAWVRCPCREHEIEAEAAARAAFTVPQRLNLLPYAGWPGAPATEAAWAATVPLVTDRGVLAIDEPIDDREAVERGSAPAVAASAARTAARVLLETGEAPDPAAAEAQVRAAVRDAIAPWALGHGDPLAEGSQTGPAVGPPP